MHPNSCTHSIVWSQVERFASGFSLRNTGEVRIEKRERERKREIPTYFKIPFIVHYLCYVFNIESAMSRTNC